MSARLLILYASQTGYAIETAERIKREGIQRHLVVEMKSMDEYSISDLPKEKLVAFVCSVTGQGEEPDSMKGFWKYLLRKNLEANSLGMLKFGVFGQGDSSYAKFNFPAKKLHKRLIQLGAEALLARGDGDDQHYLGVDGALDPWLVSFWENVLALYPIPKGKRIIPDSVLPLNTYIVERCTDIDTDSLQNSNFKRGVISMNLRETPETHFQDVRRIEISSSLEYAAGDALVVYPQNRAEKVQEVLEYFGWVEIADNFFQFSPNELVPGAVLPCWLRDPITPRTLLEMHLDIFGRPRRYFFHLLSFFALDELHVEKLREFATTEGQNDLYIYAHSMKRTTFEVLQDFTSVKLPLQYLLDLIPPIRPRSFSISSNFNLDQSKIQLLVAIVNFKTKLQKPRVGVCTDWMTTLQPGGYHMS